MNSQPATARVVDRVRGTYAFEGPRVAAAGYDARNVRVTGSLDGPRITLNGRAAAYGGTATARGFIVTPAPGRALAFDLAGSAEHVDLRKLPASTGAPKLATDLSVADYHVTGAGRSINGIGESQSVNRRRRTHRAGHRRDVRSDADRNFVYGARRRRRSGPAPSRRGARDRRARQARVRQPDQRQLRRDRQPAAESRHSPGRRRKNLPR